MKNTNKVVIITGASSGIGLCTANYLKSKGYTVYGIAITEAETDFPLYIADVCNHDRIKEIFEEIYQKEKHIDVVYNNAGMGISGALEYTEKKRIEKIFNINTIAVIDISSIAIPYLRESKGKIINTSSVASPCAIPFQACYSATKSAVETFSFALRNEVKPFGITVTCIRPGDTKTGFTANREKNAIEGDVYNNHIKKSVEKMEKDEQNGADPITVSKVVEKVIKKKNPPLVATVGFSYKLVCVLVKFLPMRFANYLIGKLYG